jgi:MarR family transcriptional regulator, transcriptional regulator for hemolysin
MPRPTSLPIGLHLTRSARLVSRAFDEALGSAGGSLPVWLVLLNLKMGRTATQRELAGAVGVREATLTHHLNGMEARGLVTRRRDPHNHRVQVVELSDAGEAAFVRLLEATRAFDQRLRTGLADADLESLSGLLDRLAANVAPGDDAEPAWGGLAEAHRADHP